MDDYYAPEPHAWLHVASDERGRTYRCVACGEWWYCREGGGGDAR